jgi:hypothetical protein
MILGGGHGLKGWYGAKQGLRERLRGGKRLPLVRTYQTTREGSKDRANGMKRKVARSSSVL